MSFIQGRKTPSGRVKWSVLIALLIISVVLALASFVTYKLMERRRFRQFREWGDAAMSQSRFDDAAQDYSRALGIKPDDAELQVKCGDALYAVRRDHPDYAARAAGFWQEEIESHPDDIAVLRRLLNYDVEAARAAPSIPAFESTRDIATRVAAIDPADQRAQYIGHSSAIKPWLLGLAPYDSTLGSEVDALSAMLEKDPNNADLLSDLISAKVQRAKDLKSQADADGSGKAIQDAAGICAKVLQSSVASTPALLAVDEGYTQLGDFQAADTTAANPYPAMAQKAIDRAAGAVDPKDPLYRRVMLSEAASLKQRGDGEGAETMYRNLLSRDPGDLSVRIALAKSIAADPTRTDEALAVMDAAPAGATTAPAGSADASLRAQALIETASLQMEACSIDIDVRAARLPAARKACDAAAAAAGDVPDVLKLKSQLDVFDGRYVAALRKLSSASDQLAARGSFDPTIEYLKAKAYAEQQEPAPAIDVLHGLLQKSPEYEPARLLLCQQLILQDEPVGTAPESRKEAEQNIEELENSYGGNPDVIAVRLKLLETHPQTPEIKQAEQTLYDDIPETARGQKLAKASIANQLGRTADARRLLEPLIAANPADVAAAGILCKTYAAEGKPDEGTRLLTDAMKAAGRPTDPSDADFKSDISRGRSEMALGRLTEAVQLFTAAHQLKPDSMEAVDALFDASLRRQDWAGASQCAAQLTAADADQIGGQTYPIRTALAQKHVKDALSLARSLTESLPQYSEGWEMLAQAYEQSADADAAIQSYRQALALHPNDLAALKQLALINTRLRRTDDAWTYIRQGRAVYPDDGDFRELELEHQLAAGNLQDLEAQYQKMYDADPDRAANAIALARVDLAIAHADAAGGSGPGAGADYLARARKTMADATARWPDSRECAQVGAGAALQAHDTAGGQAILKALAQRPAWRDDYQPTLMLADFDAAAGDMDDAESAMRSAFEKSGGVLEVGTKLASILAQRQKIDDAVAVLSKFADNPAAQTQATQILLSAKRPGDAETWLTAQLAKTPASEHLLTLIANVYRTEGKWDLAEQRADQAVAADGSSAEALAERGFDRVQKPQPNLSGGIADLSAARDLNPSDVRIRLALSDGQRRAGDLTGATSEMEAALKLAPLDASIRTRLMDDYLASRPPQWDRVAQTASEAEAIPELAKNPVWLRADARATMERGDAPQAAAKAAAAVALAPNDLPTLRDDIEVLVSAGDFAGATRDATKAISLDPQAWWAYLGRARSRNHTGDLAGAQADLDAAMTAAGDSFASASTIIGIDAREFGVDDAIKRVVGRADADPRWQFVAAELYWSKRDDARASAAEDSVLGRISELPPQMRVSAWRLGSDIYMRANPGASVDKVEDCYRQLLRVLPDDPASLNNLACFLLDQSDPPRVDEAIGYSTRAYDNMEKGTYDPAIADTQGWAMTLAGKAADALPILQEALRSMQMPDMHFHLAEAYLRTGDAKDAALELGAAQNQIKQSLSQGQPASPRLLSRIADAERRASAMLGPSQVGDAGPK